MDNLGNRLSDLGRREEALAASQPPADIGRLLAEVRPDASLPDLAMSLGALGQAHASAGYPALAASTYEEGLTVIAPLVERHRRTFEDLARALGAGHIAACEDAGQTPNQALLSRISDALHGQEGGGGATRRLRRCLRKLCALFSRTRRLKRF